MDDKTKISFPQEALWQDTLDVIIRTTDVGVLTDSRAIQGMLRFNSAETRERYARAMVTRFRRLVPEHLQGLCDLAATKYPLSIIEQIWRVLFCLSEAIVAQAYLEMVWPRDPGALMRRDEIRNYVEAIFPQNSNKLNQRLVSCLDRAGYVTPQKKDELIIVGFGNLEESLILSTHLLLAQSPRTIRLSEIESNDYWKFLGYRRFDHVKVAFRSAEAKGMIMRYAVVDHLEQITTGYSWRDLLNKRKQGP